MTTPTAPLTLAELATILDGIGGFEDRPRIAVAVSGGPDSMALALLADRWVRQRGGEAWALTVDHGLRRDSAAEARRVAGWLAARGIRHEILGWSGAKPTSGLQAAAREARYRLLTEWCERQGVLHLLTAHQREDQAETYLIRRRAGSGEDGLAAMSAVREMRGCRLVRPLLGVPRARLAALLAAERQPHVRDPSNFDPLFERARLRAFSRLPVDDIVEQTRIYGWRRIAREAALDRLIGRAVCLHPAGFAAVDPRAIATADADSAERLLARLAICIGGLPYPPRRARLARLRQGLTAAPGRARTLGGCRFVPWRGHLLVLRELAAASPPAELEPGAQLLWDRRFAAALPAAAGGGMTLGYLGQSGAASPRQKGSALLRLVHPILPAWWDREGLAAVPHLGYRRPGAEALPLPLFRPANPLTRAGFTVV